MIFARFACGQNSSPTADAGASWQEQYDLGAYYLSDGNYGKAIIAFCATIEIDPKRAPAYAGRGDAHVVLMEQATGEEAGQASTDRMEKAIQALCQ